MAPLAAAAIGKSLTLPAAVTSQKPKKRGFASIVR
jgi:hypothetical protein